MSYNPSCRAFVSSISNFKLSVKSFGLASQLALTASSILLTSVIIVISFLTTRALLLLTSHFGA